MCFLVGAAFIIKIKIVLRKYKKAQNLRRVREQEGGIKRRHTDEEEGELRNQTWQETLVSGQLGWHCGAARRTEKPGTRLGRKLLQVICWCDVVMVWQ